MNMKDTLQLANWLDSRASYNDVKYVARFGLVDNERFTEQARRAFFLAWTWSGESLSDEAKYRFWKRCGEVAFQRRIQRCRRMINRFLGHNRLFPNA